MQAPQQVSGGTPQQGQPQQMSPQGTAQAQPQGREYNHQILALIEQHLNTVPKEQQQFLTNYMTPELAILFGIVLGQEALDYFKKFADPNKTLVVQQKQNAHGGQQQPQGGNGAPPNNQPAPQSQKANPPQPSIMGV